MTHKRLSVIYLHSKLSIEKFFLRFAEEKRAHEHNDKQYKIQYTIVLHNKMNQYSHVQWSVIQEKNKQVYQTKDKQYIKPFQVKNNSTEEVHHTM